MPANALKGINTLKGIKAGIQNRFVGRYFSMLDSGVRRNDDVIGAFFLKPTPLGPLNLFPPHSNERRG